MNTKRNIRFSKIRGGAPPAPPNLKDLGLNISADSAPKNTGGNSKPAGNTPPTAANTPTNAANTPPVVSANTVPSRTNVSSAGNTPTGGITTPK